MSWQVRLGNMDEEIQDFLKENPEFPAENERDFVMYAIRDTMRNWVENEKKGDNIEQLVDKKIEDRLD